MRIGGRGWLAGIVFVAACGLGCSDGNDGTGAGGSGGAGGAGEGPPPAEDMARDIQHTALVVDLATKTTTATIDLAPSPSAGASFDVRGLDIRSVTQDGAPLQWALTQGRLDLGVPVKTDGPSQVVIEAGFKEQATFEGLMQNGSTLTWPYFCGNIFPCHPDPADGTTFALDVTGTPAGLTTVFPPTIQSSAPAYQIAWATGSYTPLDVGTTTLGTHLTAYYLPGGEAAAQTGTAPLRDVMDWYETTYGAYPFGKEAGSVSTDWGPGAYGGMEHHPLWHIATIAMGDPWIHAHEAAHGWFGDGVRIACWEDFVLSEGTVSYLEARAIAKVMGVDEETKLWTHYQSRLDNAMAGSSPKIAWPEGCGTIDVLKDGLFGDIVYMKGAFFFRALEGKIGANMVDTALKAFFAKYKGKAAHFQDLLDVTKSVVGYDATACATGWLRSEAVPAEAVCP